MIFAQKNMRHDTAAVYNGDIVHTVLAFANTEGGTLYVGVDEDGTVLGLDKAQAVANRIREDVQKSICPDLSAFVACSVIELDERPIVQVRVERGTRAPTFSQASDFALLACWCARAPRMFRPANRKSDEC